MVGEPRSPLGRVVDIAEAGRHLSKERGFLIVSSRRDEIGRVPLDDIAAVLATGHGTTVSTSLLAALAERGIPTVIAGCNFMPVALVWPLAGHHAQGRRMEAQVACGRVLGKRLWAILVAAKIARQGWALTQAGAHGSALTLMARRVRSGDPDNLEAQAARRYWPLLMGRDFRRDTSLPGANALLNYGYAILRAGVARAVCGAGLHPSLGIFHRHPHNAMPLADDLMEPFRPFVDLEVAKLLAGGESEVTVAAKRRLAAVLCHDLPTPLGWSPLATCLHRTAASLAASFASGTAALDLPLDEAGSRDTNPEWLSDHVDGADVRSPGRDEDATQTRDGFPQLVARPGVGDEPVQRLSAPLRGEGTG